MSNGVNGGTSRGGFLKQAAGATAIVAGAGAGLGAFAPVAAAASGRTYTAGRFSLEIDGVNVGGLVGVDGGDLDLQVVLDPPDSTGADIVQRKHIAGVKYEDITLQVGSNMDQAFYNWIKDSFDKGYVRKNGAVIAADFNYNEKRRTSASSAFISSVTIPALDGASKDPAYVAVNLTCDKVTDVQPSGQPVQASKQKAWLPSNFVFEVDGVDTSRVSTIDSFTWHIASQPAGSNAVLTDVTDIGVTFPKTSLASWQRWYDSLGGGADDERDGALTLVGAYDGAVITVGLYNLGLYRLSPDPASPARRVKAEMYVERMGWDLKNGTKA